MAECLRCGNQLAEGARHCGACGMNQPQPARSTARPTAGGVPEQYAHGLSGRHMGSPPDYAQRDGTGPYTGHRLSGPPMEGYSPSDAGPYPSAGAYAPQDSGAYPPLEAYPPWDIGPSPPPGAYPPPGGYPGQPAYGPPYEPAYGKPPAGRRNRIIVLVAAIVSAVLVGVCIYALVSPRPAGRLDSGARLLVAGLELDEHQRAATRALEFLDAAGANRRDVVTGYVNPDEVDELTERLGGDSAAAAYLADQLTDRVLEIYGEALPAYRDVEVQDAGDWRSTCRISMQDGTTLSVTLELVLGEYYVVGVRGGSLALSPDAMAMINALYSEEEIAVAVRGMGFIEAVLDGDADGVEEYLHPGLLRDIEEYASMYGNRSAGQLMIGFAEDIIGRNASGYERINIDLYGGGQADCDVYFITARDFIIIQLELYNGEYYVVSFY